MKEIISLDGIRMEVQPADLDGDGKVGGTEIIAQQIDNVQEIVQPTELGDSLKELNKDHFDPVQRLSDIHMRSRFDGHIEEISVFAFAGLTTLKVLPSNCERVVRLKMRMAVSRRGEGRKEIVSVVAGKRELEKAQGGFFEKTKTFMGFGGSNGEK